MPEREFGTPTATKEDSARAYALPVEVPTLRVELEPEDLDTVTLDPRDPFDRALIPMVLTNRAKRRDYAEDGSPFTNFERTADFAGFEAIWLSALFNCAQKLARITALRKNGRLDDPSNEAVEDTLLDNAVYAVIALAIYKESQENH
jgi:hypothetical protein